MTNTFNKGRHESGYLNGDGQTSLDILRLVLGLAETTEEEDVGVLGRRKAGSR